MKILLALALAATAMVASPALAGTTVFTGDTTGGPTYNRPVSGRPATILSGVGTAVRYVVTPFTVSLSGAYNFLNSARYDAFLGVHGGSFNPANALLNNLAYDDDGGPGSDSAINALSLFSGTSYFAVSSGFANSDFGAFTLTIDGPGNIIGGGTAGVPEPATWAMLFLGFFGVGAIARRRAGALVSA